MWLPCSEADPTEVVFASLAHHVIAAAILLDRCLTLRTLLQANIHSSFLVTVLLNISVFCFLGIIKLATSQLLSECKYPTSYRIIFSNK